MNAAAFSGSGAENLKAVIADPFDNPPLLICQNSLLANVLPWELAS